LIAAGADVDRQSDDRGYSPLMDAAQKGDPVMLSLLLSAGAKPDLRSKDGQTALIICAGRGDVAMSKLLIEAGADPEIKDHLGMSAARYASLFGNADLTALFNTPPA
jgi:ankyrin repeat protein